MTNHEDLIMEGLRTYNLLIRDQITLKEVDLYLHKLSRSNAPQCHKEAYRKMIMRHAPSLYNDQQLEFDFKESDKPNLPLNSLEEKIKKEEK